MSEQLPWLTDDEVRDLTGYARPTCQARWLNSHGIRCFMNALGKVRVSRDALSAVQSGVKARRLAEPDFSKMPRRRNG